MALDDEDSRLGALIDMREALRIFEQAMTQIFRHRSDAARVATQWIAEGFAEAGCEPEKFQLVLDDMKKTFEEWSQKKKDAN